ncbi:MAG: NTP transferase domain-containing protein [Labilithrix sp.]|nr:NTP transferase domain-containing protein [Labilithrix sp.]MCW5817413.1 NTP transferase domain-containing protein [Labilithrix sp.]
MILCAGLGTRLRPLTEWLAKPMVPIGDRPAVAHVTARIRAAGVARVVVNVHHRPEDLRAWAAREDVAVSEEPELLGTAGGIAQARDLLGDGDVLVWNGDILATPDLAALFAAHRHAATLAVVPRPAREGNVGLDDEGRVVRLRGESFGAESSGADFTGIHVVSGSLRALLPPRGCVVGDVYLPALRRGERLDAFTTHGPFTDVGSLAAYAAANRAWLGARRSWAAPDAEIAAAIDGSIVGAGAVVRADAIDAIVWPGAVVAAPVSRAIVTPRGTVPLP